MDNLDSRVEIKPGIPKELRHQAATIMRKELISS
jgi:hypothetical protein